MKSTRLGWAMSLLLVACGGGGAGDDGGTTHDAGPADAGPTRCTMDRECDDGLFCNGPERCLPTSAAADARGCVVTMSNPCLSIQTCNEAMGRCVTDCAVAGGDADGDSHRALECGGDDCNDGDGNAYPSNVEVCDALDHDEDCDATTFGNRDQDRDSFADMTCCNVDAAGARACGTDCADLAASVHPGATEACNGFDDDCNGMVDEGVTVAGFADVDGDLHGDPASATMACAGSAHFSTTSDDCDDHDVRRNGGQVEVCDGLDNDCDGAVDDDTRPVTWYLDGDGDGFGNAHGGTMTACAPPLGYSLLPIDCDDTLSGVNPAATELCDGRDDDCNGRKDFAIGPNDFEDDDADGAIDLGCGGAGTDCDDGDATVHPGADAICDGRDHDCDGMADTTGAGVDWLADIDGDGWGTGAAIHQCMPVAGRVTRGGDCDDSNPTRHPGAVDVCNGIDDDCNGTIDDTLIQLAFYTDADHDGAGGATPILACTPPPGASLFPNDCDDADARRFPGAAEVCNGLDDNCDGTTDETTSASLCALSGIATAHCAAGACVIDTCTGSFANCDGTVSNGCESDRATDPANCGACGTVCPTPVHATPTCAAMSCGSACDATHGDCDTMPGNGCETDVTADPRNCGACGMLCTTGAHATPLCAGSTCAITCDAGYTNCDAMIGTGCEVHTDADPLHCGACGTACGTGQVCASGHCYDDPFPSDGSELAFAPTADVTLSPGIHDYTTITIPAGVTVRTSGDTLELRATGAVVIDGTVDLSGGAGGTVAPAPSTCTCTPVATDALVGNGGATGTARPATASAAGMCTGMGGSGGVVGLGHSGGPLCADGGHFGGGAGGQANAGGGGGGGPAGGAGGGGGSFGSGGAGGEIAGLTTGGRTDRAGGQPFNGQYSGYDGNTCGAFGDGGGGGAIGELATADLAVRTTFTPGSGGGGGTGWNIGYGCNCNGGGGGGGGGGALRITSPVSITISGSGIVRADGGAGGQSNGALAQGGGHGGGGSGGVVYLAAPRMLVSGRVSTVGGVATPNTGSCGGGSGGIGRIRFSLVPALSTLSGTITPPVAAGTAPTATREHPYVDLYPL